VSPGLTPSSHIFSSSRGSNIIERERHKMPSQHPIANISSANSKVTMMSKSNGVKSASSSLVLLFRLIEANDWNKLYNMFLNESDDAACRTFQYLANIVAKSSNFSGMTILHAVSRFDPPSILVKRIIELCPGAPAAQDVLNRTPLHVAAGTGAGSVVIKVLVDAYPRACLVQDTDGRTPLHMACDTSTELFEDNRGSRTVRETPSYRSIGVLLRGSLDSAIVEDEDGMSAIEYALCSDAELQTVRLIQKAAQKVHVRERDAERKAKAEQERRRVSDIETNYEKKAASDIESADKTAARQQFRASRRSALSRSLIRNATAA